LKIENSGDKKRRKQKEKKEEKRKRKKKIKKDRLIKFNWELMKNSSEIRH